MEFCSSGFKRYNSDMGWRKLRTRTDGKPASGTFNKDSKVTTEHIESTPLSSVQKRYTFVDISVPDNELPLVPAQEVTKRKSAEDGGLCK